MNILLVYPRPNISFDTTHCIPLGLGYIAAVLEKEGHQVSCLDLNVQKDDLEERVKKADIVGIYAITPAVKAAWRLCERVKTANPAAMTVLGGPHPSVLPGESLEQGSVDAVIRNEGELTFLEFCEALEGGKGLDGIRGLSYKEGGRAIHNPPRELIKDLDALPYPAYHLFPLDSYSPTRPTWMSRRGVKPASIVTSRGCPYECVFCFHGVFGNTYRYRSPRSVVDEIKFLKEKYGVNLIEFQDDNFNLIPKRAIEICRLMVEEGVDIRWSIPNGLSRVDKVSREFLHWARKAGCMDVWFAVESGSQRVLDGVINKGTRLEQIRDAVKMAKEFGFDVGAFVCLGNPGETGEDMERSIEFAKSLDLDKCQFTIATPFPGSRLYEMIKREGRLLIEDWDHFGPYENRAFFEYGETRRETVEEMYKRAFKSFYFRPSYVLKTLRRPTTYTNLPIIVKDLLHFMT